MGTIGASLTPNDLSATKSAKYVFVLLTNELMSNPAAIALLALLTSQKGAPEIVTCSIDRSFCFPSVSFYSDIVKGKALSEGFVADVHGFMTNADSAFVRQDNHSLSLSLIANAYRELFTKLSLPFSPQGSKEVIDVEVQGLLRRLKCDNSETSPRVVSRMGQDCRKNGDKTVQPNMFGAKKITTDSHQKDNEEKVFDLV